MVHLELYACARQELMYKIVVISYRYLGIYYICFVFINLKSVTN